MSALATLHDAVQGKPGRSLLATALIWASGVYLHAAERLLDVPEGTMLRARLEQEGVPWPS